ncbi:hypothetical protein V3C99_018924, partial [Haemonchus contortus]
MIVLQRHRKSLQLRGSLQGRCRIVQSHQGEDVVPVRNFVNCQLLPIQKMIGARVKIRETTPLLMVRATPENEKKSKSPLSLRGLISFSVLGGAGSTPESTRTRIVTSTVVTNEGLRSLIESSI